MGIFSNNIVHKHRRPGDLFVFQDAGPGHNIPPQVGQVPRPNVVTHWDDRGSAKPRKDRSTATRVDPHMFDR